MMIIFLLLVCAAIAIVWQLEKKKLTARINALEREKQELYEQIHNLEKKIAALIKYEAINDVAAYTDELLAEAKKNAANTIRDAKKIYNDAKASAGEILKRAEEDVKTQKINSDNIRKTAMKEAALVIENAEKKAQEIAGNAYEAMRNAAEFEKTVEAIKNSIGGYGTQYIVPAYSLLDDLAEDFRHTDAGEKLRLAREKTRSIIERGMAAKCEYMDDERRETAKNFVLDAYNGKVDSILSKVKKDNYGVLAQKIKDAYQVVNYLGRAFRNASITEAYELARLDELKWAVITQELKHEEQEEQRRIKEQIREEEKAKKEFEKAIREAQKEEESLKKLIEKAQKEAAQANDAQRASYEERLRELEGKLQLAEEKNQRALSMAQQTKMGNVYVISNIGSFGENVYKIGMTRRLEPLDRVRELGDASVPFEFDVHAMIPNDNAPALERELHKKFMRLQMNKLNPRKEFFKISLAEIKAELDKMNLNPKWTLVAEAKQYRESLAIEEEIKTDNQKRLEWERYQLQAEAVAQQETEEIES